MSLRSVTERLNGVVEAIALIVAVGFWAFYGFPIWELVAFGCLVLVCIGGFWWMEGRR